MAASLSIGALSRATDIPIATLRTWERRYGFPSPVRTPSGHRRYDVALIDRLRLVQKALEQGHRASTVVPADAATLRTLLALVDGVEPPAPTVSPGEEEPARERERGDVSRWPQLVAAVEGLEPEALSRELDRAWAVLGYHAFCRDALLPLLDAVDAGWRTGTMDIAHRHLCRELVRDFLAGCWRRLARQLDGAPRIVVAGVPATEDAVLLQVAAMEGALLGLRPVALGIDTPEGDIAQVARRTRSVAVVAAVAEPAGESVISGRAAGLRRACPGGVHILLIGGGAQAGAMRGIRTAPGLLEIGGALAAILDATR